jgi:hypothetical protein
MVVDDTRAAEMPTSGGGGGGEVVGGRRQGVNSNSNYMSCRDSPRCGLQAINLAPQAIGTPSNRRSLNFFSLQHGKHL